jgi:hypothetical protein
LHLYVLLFPLALGIAVVARYSAPTVLMGLLVLGIQGVGLALFFSTVKRFGWQPLRFERGGITVGSTGVRIERHKVHRWTLVRRAARLHGGDQSFRLRARRGAEQDLEALLERQFGAPTRLYPRGSFRARMTALAAMAGGLVVAPLAAVNDVMWLFMIGVAAVLIGLSTFLGLSQRVA